MKIITSFTNKENIRGGVIVETALVLPILLIVALGAIGYGWAIFAYLTMSAAAHEGARIGITSDATNEIIAEKIQQRLAVANLDRNCVVDDSEQSCLDISCDADAKTLTVTLTYSPDSYAIVNDNTLGLPMPTLVAASVIYKNECA